MVPAFAAATLAGVAVGIGGAALLDGWLRALLVVVGAAVGLMAVGSLGFFLWGRYVGFGWHFTP